MNEILQDVEIAESVLEQYLATLRAVNGGGLTQHLDQAAQIGSAEQMYPEIWSRLDRARTSAVPTGRDLSYYDQIRAFVGNGAAHGVTSRSTNAHGIFLGPIPIAGALSLSAEGNEDGVRAARDAIAVFRHQFPELPWGRGAAEPVPELRTGQGPAKVIAVVGAILLVGGFLAFYLGLV